MPHTQSGLEAISTPPADARAALRALPIGTQWCHFFELQQHEIGGGHACYVKVSDTHIAGFWINRGVDHEVTMREQGQGARFEVDFFGADTKFSIIRYGTGEENHAT